MNALYRCEWCTNLGLPSLHSGLLNGERLIGICTDCSNRLIPDEIRGHYGRPIPLKETGLERHDREARLAAVINEGDICWIVTEGTV